MICLAESALMPEAPWSTTVGKNPHTIWVGERGLGGMVYVRWTVCRKPVPRSLGFKVRDSRGRLLKREQKKALATAKRMVERHAQGLDPEDILRTASGVESDAPKIYLSLEAALGRYLRVPTGNFLRRSEHWQDAQSVSTHLFAALGTDFSMGDLLPTTAEAVWRHVLEAALEEGDEPTGYRKAEKAVQLLYAVARWIADRSPGEANAVTPMRGWHNRLREEWEEAFDSQLPDAKKLRHSPAETLVVFRNLPNADPRLRQAIEIGVELREGQVSRTRRSQLDLGAVGAYELGQIEIAGKGKKRGEIVHLHPELRAYIDECLSERGHLWELEQAYQAGRIDDYYLWQKGKLRRDRRTGALRIPLTRHLGNPGPMDPGSLIDLFRQFESSCGVEHVAGRSFYGLRRVLTDIAPDYTNDPRALDRLTGHDDPATRERRYQDRMRDEDREAAAVARREMRADLVAGRLPLKRQRKPQRTNAALEVESDRVRTALQRLTGLEISLEQAEEILQELGRENTR